MKFLKAQLADLERQHMQHKISIYDEDPWRLPTSLFVQTSPSLNLWSKEQAEIKVKRVLKNTNSRGVKKTPCLKEEAKENPDDSPIMASSKAPEILPFIEENYTFSFLKLLGQEDKDKADEEKNYG
ncbi:hypothetical protein Hanom_Chr07g00589651 [Helianthus anomalus]